MICSGPSAPLLISAAQLDVDDADGGEGVHFVALSHTHCLHLKCATHPCPSPGCFVGGAGSCFAAGAGRVLAAETPGPWRCEFRGTGKTRVFLEVQLFGSQGSISCLLCSLRHIRGSQKTESGPDSVCACIWNTGFQRCLSRIALFYRKTCVINLYSDLICGVVFFRFVFFHLSFQRLNL